LKILFFGFLYGIGLLPLKKALIRIVRVMRNVPVELLTQILEKLPLKSGSKEVFAALKVQGCKTALISSGLPNFIVEALSRQLGADYAFGIEVGVKNGVLTGEVWGDALERKGKFLVLKKLMESEGVTAKELTLVADDRNNASMFLKEARKIGYDADFLVRIKADVVINGKFAKVLPAINCEARPRPTLTRNDIVREMIHASGFFVPIVASFISVPLAAALICLVVAFYVISEFQRLKGRGMPLISNITRHAASQSELSEFTLAPIYFAAGIVVTLLLFPMPASSAAIAVFTVGDSTASIVGGRLSKKPLPFHRAKSLEGSLAGFFFAFLAALVFVSPWFALLGAAFGMFVEYLPLPVNDNLLMPLFTGLALALLI
jgi:HAD superfamily phosphoserine phosphatase-like hydrolase